MFKNVASQSVSLFAFDYSTGAPKTGDAANMVFYVSKDDGSVTAITSNSGVPTEIDSTNAKGWYKIAVSQTETNADKLLFTGKSATSNITVVGVVLYTTPPNFTTFSIDSSGRVVVITNSDKTGYTLTSAGYNAAADALLARNIDGGSSTGRTVLQALAFLRNKWTLVGTTLTVYDVDDTTVLWTATVGTDAAAVPIVSSDPA